MTTLCFDYDPLLYAAGAQGEKKSIHVVHRESGDEYEFANRTLFWGHHGKKAGGYLAEWNAGKTTPRMPDEFDITDVQTPEPITHCLHTLKAVINRVKEYVDAKKYYGYSGKGTVFREHVSTMVKYKGNRDNVLRPIHLDDLKQYLVRNHACEIVVGIEADDAVAMDSRTAYLKWKQTGADEDLLVTAAVDKDYDQCAMHIVHPFDLGEIRSHDGSFGWLDVKVTEKTVKGKPVVERKVFGRGRKWLYQQVLDGDDADNYFANAASQVKWGQMSAYDLLKDAKNDKEAFQALVKGYKTLYPQPVEWTGWRGDRIVVDWLYALQENFTLAMMLRHKDDKMNVKETLTKLGVEH